MGYPFRKYFNIERWKWCRFIFGTYDENECNYCVPFRCPLRRAEGVPERM